MSRKKRGRPHPPMPATSPSEPVAPAEKPEKKPGSIWTLVLTMTPIFLTLVATALAGISSSELMRSMYFRSLAAQNQAKAGDQWAYFQAKRIRGTTLEATIDLFQGLAAPPPFTPALCDDLLGRMNDALGKAGPEAETLAKQVEALRARLARQLAGTAARAWAGPGVPKLPVVEPEKLSNAAVRKDLDALLVAIRQRQSEAETLPLVARIPAVDLDEATHLAEAATERFDRECDRIRDDVAQVRILLDELAGIVRPLRPPAGGRAEGPAPVELYDALLRSFKATALDFEARRYRADSAYNRAVAELYEARVRQSGWESDRHRNRSAWFFYSMLLAQGGVALASLALARQQRRSLWLVAALSGFVALAFGGVVFTAF